MVGSRAQRSSHAGMSMHEVTVVAARSVTPHLRRVTLAAPSLKELADDGPDQRFKLLLPRPGQSAPTVPHDPDRGWYDEWLAMPAAERPVLRTYTVRELRRDDCEVDVDVVLHEGEDGPGSAWARAAQPGDRVALYGSYGEHEADPAWRQLVAGDHSALPAVAAILARLGAHGRGDVLIEVPGPEDRLDLAAPPGVTVRWVDERPGDPGGALVEAVTALPAEPRWDYAWVCGEQKAAAAMRRHLVRGLDMPRDRVMFMGYWRRGGAIDVDPADPADFAAAVQEAEAAEDLEPRG